MTEPAGNYDRYRIVTDGTSIGTKVFGPNGDDFLRGVQAVHVSVVKGQPRLELALKSRKVVLEYADGTPPELRDAAEFWLSIREGLVVRHEEPPAVEE